MIRQILVKIRPGMKGGRLLLDNIRMGMNTYAITKDNRLVETTKGLIPSDEVFETYLSDGKYYKVSYDDSPQTQNKTETQSHKERARIADILRYHYNIYTEGFDNPNLKGEGMFVYEDITGNHIKTVAHIDTRIRAEWKFKNMSFQQKVDAMYYYKENPYGMTHSEVYVRMLEPQFGIILQRTPWGSQGKTIVEHFADIYKADESHVQLKTVILKAMLITIDSRPIVEKRNDALMFGDDVLGLHIEDAMSWFANNPQMLQTLEQMVAEHDKSGLIDDLDKVEQVYEKEISPEKQLNQEKVDTEIYRTNLEKEAKQLRMHGYWTMGTETLEKNLVEARNIWREAEELGLQYKITTKTKLSDLEELVRIEKKKIAKAKELATA